MDEHDITNLTGEMIGDFKDIFFKTKDGKSLIPAATVSETVSIDEIAKATQQIGETAERISSNPQIGNATIIINNGISEESDENIQIELSDQETNRMYISTITGKEFINILTGDFVVILDRIKSFNGTVNFLVETKNGDRLTYPRSKFIGSKKEFVPKDFYVQEAEIFVDSLLNKHSYTIDKILRSNQTLLETKDKEFLEFVLDNPIKIEGMIIPDKLKMPVNKIFDLEYKIMNLRAVIIVNNAIASLLFEDYWF